MSFDVPPSSSKRMTLKSNIEILGSLLKNNTGPSSKSLTSDEIAALEQLHSSILSSFSDENSTSSKSLMSKKGMKSMKSITKSMKENEEDEDLTIAYKDVLLCNGITAVGIQNVVQFRTGHSSNSIKTIPLRNATRVSGHRLGKMIQSYNGNKASYGLRISELSQSDRGSELSLSVSSYIPPEWTKLTTTDVKTRLTKLLSWDNLANWQFSIVEVSRLTDHPLLFVGWVLFCEPIPFFMCESTTKDEEDKEQTPYRYRFAEYIDINPEQICNFLREIESRYNSDVPYHNNIHAADVTQTLHCIFQMMDQAELMRIYSPMTIFSLLLAATYHDVGHDGYNNTFHQNALTPFAIQYNDVSVLENMHSHIGNSLLFGEEKRDEWDLFGSWPRDAQMSARKVMISGILGTDMSGHFTHMEELNAVVEEVHRLQLKEFGTDEEQPILSILSANLDINESCDEQSQPPKLVEECKKLADLLLIFLLHSADVSNPAKRQDVTIYWAEKALFEFFLQGDREKEMGLPVSPLCDRTTVKKPDSQIGFSKFVIQPAFDLLAEIIPRVNEEVIPIIQSNLKYWKKEKSRHIVQ